MKCLFKLLLLFLFASTPLVLFSEERVDLVKNKISIINLSDVLMPNEIPDFKDLQERYKYLGNKYHILIEYNTESDFKKMDGWEIPSKINDLISAGNFNSHNLKSLLNKASIVLYDYLPMADLQSSLQHIEHNGEIIGETYFSASSDGLLCPGSYGFHANIVVDNAILSFELLYFDNNYDIAKRSRYFEYKENSGYSTDYFWKARSSKADLYNDIISSRNKDEIKELILLNDYWNKIISSINFVRTKKGILNDSQVRVRSQPNLNGKKLGYLQKDQVVEILDETHSKMKIGKMDSVWYKIKTSDGMTGWAYGWFIDIQED